MIKNLIRKLVNWCIKTEVVEIQDLHQNPENCLIYDNAHDVKFIERSHGDYAVLTPKGFSPVKQCLKTKLYEVYTITTSRNKQLRCADDHLLIDSDGNQIHAKDSLYKLINTTSGLERITDVKYENFSEHMYDLELDDINHVYYTNNILSHNTETASAFLLWYAIFNEAKTVLIASNKGDNAMEVISKIQMAYEELPSWLKPGIDDKEWNKHNCAFDNKSRIISTATSASSGRGLPISLLYCDEFAHLEHELQTAFWTSIFPTLSTGGAAIITSTPKGDVDMFAELWRGADAGTNDFHPFLVKWDDHPERNEEFKLSIISKIGQRLWEQEYECQFLSSESSLISGQTIARIEAIANKHEVAFTLQDQVFWKNLDPRGIYYAAIDPSTGSGKDCSVLNVFEFPRDGSAKIEQIMEYRSNSITIDNFYVEAKKRLRYIENNCDELYWTLENNNVGEGIIALYRTDENQLQRAMLISEPDKDNLGFRTGPNNKTKNCVRLKDMLDRDMFKLYSKDLIKELKSFIRKGATFQAKTGSTDDSISTMLLIIRMMEAVANFDSKAHDIMFKIEELPVANTGWGDTNLVEVEVIDESQYNPFIFSFG